MSYMVTKDDLLNESLIEIVLLNMEIEGLEDEYLVEEIMHISADVDLEEGIDVVLNEFFNKGRLSRKNRVLLESVYKLFHVEHCIEE